MYRYTCPYVEEDAECTDDTCVHGELHSHGGMIKESVQIKFRTPLGAQAWEIMPSDVQKSIIFVLMIDTE
jgi:hypothetical protein